MTPQGTSGVAAEAADLLGLADGEYPRDQARISGSGSMSSDCAAEKEASTACALDQATRDLAHVRRLVTGSCMLAGTVLSVGGLLAWSMREFRVITAGPNPYFYGAVTLGGFPFFAVAILPSDERAVRNLVLFFKVATGGLTALFTMLAASTARRAHSSSAQWVTALWFSLSIIGLVAFRNTFPADKLGSRAALMHMWCVGRTIGVALGIFYMLYSCLRGAVSPSFVEAGHRGGAFMIGSASLFYSAITAPANRRALHSWLRMRGGQSPTSSAGVAVLVGGDKTEEVLRHAKQTFRAIPFSSLRPSDVTCPVVKGSDGLDSRAQPVLLGECDAFCSHVRRAAAFEPLGRRGAPRAEASPFWHAVLA